jgi:predicted MFS family arabinose efflux permease
MFSTVTRITLTPQVRSIFGRGSMIRVSNYLEGADAIGTVIGPVMAGVIFSVWGGMGIFGVLTLLFVGSSLGLAILGRHDASAGVQAPARLNHVFDGLRVLITPPLLTLSVVDWVANFVSIAVVLDLVLIAARHLHLPDSSTGLVFTLSGIGNFMVVVILDRVQNRRRFHPVKTLGIALGVSVLGSVVLLTSGTYCGLAVGYVVLDGGMAAIFVMNGAMRNMVTSEDKLVAMRAGITFSNQMARAIGSMVPGVLFAWWNGRILLGIVALCGVALLTLVWFGRSALSENTIREGATQQ